MTVSKDGSAPLGLQKEFVLSPRSARSCYRSRSYRSRSYTGTVVEKLKTPDGYLVSVFSRPHRTCVCKQASIMLFRLNSLLAWRHGLTGSNTPLAPSQIGLRLQDVTTGCVRRGRSALSGPGGGDASYTTSERSSGLRFSGYTYDIYAGTYYIYNTYNYVLSLTLCRSST